METKELPQTGDYIELEFDKEHGGGTDTIQGEVIEVEDNPRPPADLQIEVDEGTPNQKIVFSKGTYEGEPYAWVERINEMGPDCKIGENGEWSILTA